MQNSVLSVSLRKPVPIAISFLPVVSRRTDVRPIFNRRAISDLPIAMRNRSLAEPALPAAVGGWPSRLPCNRACAKPARTRSHTMSLSNAANTESSPAIARPAGVARSRASVTETKPTSSAVSSCKVLGAPQKLTTSARIDLTRSPTDHAAWQADGRDRDHPCRRRVSR